MMTNNELYTVSELSSLKGITFLHWNCHSLYPKFEEIVHILKNGDAEVNILTESWTTACIPDGMIEVNGYNLFRQDRANVRKKGEKVSSYTLRQIKISNFIVNCQFATTM